jgi:trk system potassium uptake protein TrkH
MDNIRPVIFVVGLLLCTLGAGMALPALVDLHSGNQDWRVFFLAMLATFFFGGMMVLSTAADRNDMTITRRQGFLMIVLAWVLLSLFGAVPLWFAGELSLTDAVFESVSGLTTTGATIMTNLQEKPPGILLWRAILQWLGGIGVVLMAMSIMPFLKIGGMQLFESEMTESEKALPRAGRMAASIGFIYVVLTTCCVVLYYLAGMTPFDAVAHAMTTISTGGYSTYDTSFSHYDTPWLEIVAIIFMIMGGLPFVLYLKAMNGNVEPFLKDTQVRWFLSILAVAILLMCLYQLFARHIPIEDSILHVAFNVVSVMTGTGYANDDFNAWGALPVSMFFFLMFIGACAGSTTCGIKIFRFQILYAIAIVQLKRLIYPHGVFVPYYNNRPVPEGVPASVMSFFFLFALTFAASTLALSWVGLDFITAMSGAATAISNMGPGLGDIIGPAGTFQPLPDSAKWILIASMIVGRLEIFTVLVLFTPHFWRR